MSLSTTQDYIPCGEPIGCGSHHLDSIWGFPARHRGTPSHHHPLGGIPHWRKPYWMILSSPIWWLVESPKQSSTNRGQPVTLFIWSPFLRTIFGRCLLFGVHLGAMEGGRWCTAAAGGLGAPRLWLSWGSAPWPGHRAMDEPWTFQVLESDEWDFYSWTYIINISVGHYIL